MKWTEGQIAGWLARYTFQRKCLLIVPNCSWPGNECDLLAVTMNLRIIDVEIKTSRADFRADAGKDKWWRRRPWSEYAPGIPRQQQRDPRLWPGKVWKHYYCMPREIWRDEMAGQAGSPESGILLITESRHHTPDFSIQVERPAHPNRSADKLSAEDAIDIARLAGLRMWDAYEQVDRLTAERRLAA